MKEKVIVKSIKTYQDSVKKILCICAIITGICVLLFMYSNFTLEELSHKKFWSSTSWEEKDRITETMSKWWQVYDTSLYLGIGLILVTVVLIIFYFYIAKMEIVVTDKRVYGKTSFGKQVDLPLDSISSVGTSAFEGISVGTSSGCIKFLGISNRDKIYTEIKKILADRQTKEVKASAPVTNITQVQSSADELKKFKELLDSGIITQEEFDAKKKQLLGL